MVWPLFSEQSNDKFFHTVAPLTLPIQLANLWLQGRPYLELFERSKMEKGTKPWGKMKPRRITEDEIIDLCERTLGFECSLILAAVAQFMFGENVINIEGAAALTLFQKALKYGIPDWLSISCYEQGFADRVVAQHLSEILQAEGFSDEFISRPIEPYRQRLSEVLLDYPSYFETVLMSLN
jgi:POLQ-like helicase